MSTTTSTKIPGPVYAVAGAGDLAYRQLLNSLPRVAELPARVEALRAELPGRVEQLRAGLPGRVEQLRSDLPVRMAEFPARVEALRTELRTEVPAAVNSFVAEAVSVYSGLVARGTKVVANARTRDAAASTSASTSTSTSTSGKKAPARKKAVKASAAPAKAPVAKAPVAKATSRAKAPAKTTKKVAGRAAK
jgi:hypothetical protein